MKKIMFALLLAISSQSYAQVYYPPVSNSFNSQARSTAFQANENDLNVSEMVQRWGNESQQTVYWDSNEEFDILNYKEFNRKVGLNRGDNLVRSIRRVLDFIRVTEPDREPMQVCVYDKGDVTAVVRTISIGCDKPTF